MCVAENVQLLWVISLTAGMKMIPALVASLSTSVDPDSFNNYKHSGAPTHHPYPTTHHHPPPPSAPKNHSRDALLPPASFPFLWEYNKFVITLPR